MNAVILADLTKENLAELKLNARIIFTIAKKGKPLTLGELAQELSESKSKLTYHLRIMEDNGTIFRYNGCSDTDYPTYAPQQIFYEVSYINELLDKFTVGLEYMLANMEFPEDLDKEEITKANLRIAAELFSLNSKKD